MAEDGAVLVVSRDEKRRQRAVRALRELPVTQATDLSVALEQVSMDGSIVALIDAELPTEGVSGLLDALGDPNRAVLWVDKPQTELFRSGALVQVPYTADDGILRGAVRRSIELAELKSRFDAAGPADLDGISQAVREVRHAINSPLTAIMAEVELMLMDADDLGEEQVSGLRTIEEMARRIRDLVAELKTIGEG